MKTKNPPICMKIRGGVEVDSKGNKAGKDPLLSENLSMTLGTSQDQYLFHPILFEAYQHHGWRLSNVAGTLTAGQNDGVRGDTPIIVSETVGALCASDYKGVGSQYVDEGKCVVIKLNKDDVQSKAVIDPNGIAPPLYAGECRGGGGELYVCIEGNGSRPSHRGDGYKVDDKMYTLNTIDRHAVCYGISSMDSNAMRSSNPHSGIYEAKTSRTLDLNGGNPACNQGGIIVCQTFAMQGFGDYKESNKASGLKARDYKDSTDLCVYPKSIHDFVAENNSDAPHQQDLLQTADGVARTLAASTHGAAPHLTKTVIRMDNQYIVRRLTPTECCRLQGFPDGWGEIDHKEDFTDDEYEFWLDVRNTYASINGKKTGEYTKEQMLKWYNKLHTDSAEYKMWGNGIGLPNALYVMEGIAEELGAINE